MAAAAAILAIKGRKERLATDLEEEPNSFHMTNAQRRRFMDELARNNLSFISDVAGGKVNSSTSSVGRQGSGAAEGMQEENGAKIIDAWPQSRPPFLTERHYRILLTMPFNESLWNSYMKGPEGRSPTISSQAKVVPVDYSPSPLEDGKFDAADDGEESRRAPDFVILCSFNEFFFLNQRIAADHFFNGLVVLCIVIAGILVGVQSYPSMDGNLGLLILDWSVQILFTFECIFKIFAEGRRPLVYWFGPERSWNNFDFWLVLVCWLPVGGNVAFLRLLRLMRLLKLVGKVKQLQVIVMGLIKGLSSVSYIMILMLLIFYLFAVMGVGSFRKNDPFHFGSLGIAMLTLFRCSTLEDWSDVMYINMYGCASQYTGVDGVYYGLNGGPPGGATGEPGLSESGIGTAFGYFPMNQCWNSQPQPFLATVYFLFFVLIAAFVMLSLFVGAVCGGMSEAMEAFKEQEAHDKEAKQIMQRLELEAEAASSAVSGPGSPSKEIGHFSIPALREAFDACDRDGGGDIDAQELAYAMSKMGIADVSVDTAQEMITSVDDDGGGTMGFEEFVTMMTRGNVTEQHLAAEREKESVENVDDTGVERSNSKNEKMMAEAREMESRERAHSLALVNKIRRAWQGKKERYHFAIMEENWWKSYLQLSCKAEEVANDHRFVNGITMTIIAAGILVGIQTELAVPGEEKEYPVLDALDNVILAIFSVEIVVKLVAEGHDPLRFFDDSWNKFDFFIVVACFAFMLPFMPDVSSMLAMLRLLRLLRVLKLVKALPELRIIIEALISGFGSISFVTIILFMFFYLFANIGMIFFGENDPMHFGNLQSALLSLFRASTLDDWTDIMYINMYGCDHWEYGYGRKFGEKATDKKDHANCNHPFAWGWVAGFFMVSFVILGALVLLTLFIGIVATAMEEAKHDQKIDAKREERLVERVAALGIEVPLQLELYRNIYKGLDMNSDGLLSPEDMKPMLRALPLLHLAANAALLFSRAEDAADHGSKLDDTVIKEMNALKEASSGSVIITRSDIDKLCTAMNKEYSGSVEFNEFLVIMEFLRRSSEEPQAVDALRVSYAAATSSDAVSRRSDPNSQDSEDNENNKPTGSNCRPSQSSSQRSISRAELDIDVEELDPGVEDMRGSLDMIRGALKNIHGPETETQALKESLEMIRIKLGL